MPKMKTRKAAAKRYCVSANGKVRFKKQGLRHILTKKTTKRKRNLRKKATMTGKFNESARVMMPYSF